jgi:hypothetical protein
MTRLGKITRLRLVSQMRQARAPCIALVEAAPQLLEVRLAMLSEAMQKGREFVAPRGFGQAKASWPSSAKLCASRSKIPESPTFFVALQLFVRGRTEKSPLLWGWSENNDEKEQVLHRLPPG